MRRDFHPLLLSAMRENPAIHVLSIDLGYKMFDQIAAEFPSRFHQFSATEQLAVAAAVGMTHDGLKPIVYSICPFLLKRPFEIIDIYLEHERAPVKLVGGGRGKDYQHDGYSHDATNAGQVLDCWPHIRQFWPETIEELKEDVDEWINCTGPAFLSLKR